MPSDLDDDDDGYSDTHEAACGSDPYDSSSVPEDGVEFDGVTCLTAESETDDSSAPFPWWVCCLLLLLLLLLPAGDGVRLGALLFLRGGICEARTKTRKAGCR